MHGEPGLAQARERTLWLAIGRMAKLAAIAAPVVGLVVWLASSSFAPKHISIHVLDATEQYLPGDLQLRGPADETAYLDAGWTCSVDVSWAGKRVRILDGRTGIELTSAYLRPDSEGLVKIWIR